MVVAQVMADANGKVLADVVAAEMSVAQDELDNRSIVTSLTTALSVGAPQLVRVISVLSVKVLGPEKRCTSHARAPFSLCL